jgi:hypothetical protein
MAVDLREIRRPVAWLSEARELLQSCATEITERKLRREDRELIAELELQLGERRKRRNS